MADNNNPGMHSDQTQSLPPDLSRPAQRALAGAGYTQLEQLAAVNEQEISKLHGVGPKALNQLRRALDAKGLQFGDKTGSNDNQNSTRMENTMKTVTSKDGTVIAYDQLGQGPAVILVSGGSVDRSSNAPLAEVLAQHFTVYNYDRRGRGPSGDTQPYAVEREVEDIDAVISGAGGSAFLYGASSGAALALEAAASGLAITKLALWEPPFIIGDSRPRPPADTAGIYNELVSSGRRGDAVEYFMCKVVGLPAEFAAQARNSPWWPAQEALAHTLAYDATIMGDYSLPAERAASVTVPTLVMDGGASFDWIRKTARVVAEILPNGTHRTLEGQTHDVAPDAMASVLRDFFQA